MVLPDSVLIIAIFIDALSGIPDHSVALSSHSRIVGNTR
jgi:hypothetical protein